jgi:glycosyltransferase involved in cell wall biosynthesis
VSAEAQASTAGRPSTASRPSVTIVGPGFHLLGGLSVYTCRLANALSETHRVSVLLLHKVIPAALYPGGARAGAELTSLSYDPRVKIIGSLNWYWGVELLRVLLRLKRNPPELLVLQWWTAASLHTYLLLAVAARRLGIPVVVEFHETQDTGEAALPLVAGYCRRLMPALLARISGALVHNDHDLALLHDTYGRDAFAHVAVEIAPHGPYDQLTGLADDQPAADLDHTRLLFFGLIRPYKGLEDLIGAFNGLTPSEAEQFTLTVVGETWEKWTTPAEMIAASPYQDRITFVNRYVSDAEAAQFFAAADVVVLPYRRGSASGPLQIAMSTGLHVVLYAVGGLVQAVESYRGGVLVPPNDVTALRQALLAIRPHRSERFDDPHSWSATSDALGRLATAIAS